VVEPAPLLDVDRVTLRYRAARRTVTATEDVSVRLQPGERLAVLGPSGCGKSTLLKAVAGYHAPAAGRIAVAGREVTAPGPDRAVVFQEFDQLLPWKSVRENVAFAVRTARGAGRVEAERVAAEHLERVRLADFADAYPHTLSGGMKQRVAIARCLALRPDVVLMDEPFAALDALTRRRMQDEVLALWHASRFTLFFVTHSIAEAVRVGTRILLLSAHPGRVEADVLVGGAGDGPEARALHARIRELLYRDAEDWCI
jgi:NitT/TauT family transport system ATP-binding protein